MESTTTAPASLVAAIGDQCVACSAPLAGDQRYCLQCGERRGAPRMPFMDGRTRPASAPAPPSPPRRRPRGSAGATLVAGVATLLLAMGVGVLIGKSGHDKTTKGATPAVQVVTVPGGGAAASAATTNTTPTASTDGTNAKKSSHAKSKHAGAASDKNTPAAKKAAPPATVTVGSPGHGKGYKNGKFTGDFFGQ